MYAKAFDTATISSATLIENGEAELEDLCLNITGVHDCNLAYIPKHRKFETKTNLDFDRKKDVKKAFLELGYGERMSDALCRNAGRMILRVKTVSLRAVQKNLVSYWKEMRAQSMLPLCFRREKMVLKGQTCLVFSSGKVQVARAKSNIAANATVGANVGFPKGRLGAQLSMQILKKLLLTEEIVSTLSSAVGHLTGKKLNFISRHYGWFKPSENEMCRMTGVLSFLHVNLLGRVKPRGVFANVLPSYMLEDLSDLQIVDFDLPSPYGIIYCTHCEGVSPNGDVVKDNEYREFFFQSANRCMESSL